MHMSDVDYFSMAPFHQNVNKLVNPRANLLEPSSREP
ncbi:unnamed protein product [Nezara viridula]|uniref:Uncharacterized protein n=1 Tax=Nezara viridula TaxID=85310 RepID=A0A9P0HP78_NEZVI|nr:unnamed protein product [Nezara viridula]